MMMDRKSRIPMPAIVAAACLLLSGCDHSSQELDLPGVTKEERVAGQQQHAQILATMGGEYRGDADNYVRSIGAQIASAAGLRGQCNFTLVNSDVVNAFAVPGCFIYVTRGLLAVVASEDELASVLGHEVGHIVARHSARQRERSLWSLLGIFAVSLTGSDRLTRIAGRAVSLFGLRYSREEEYEADVLGIQYVSKAGYDPFAAADMLHALGRQERFIKATNGDNDAHSLPEWASSHPLPVNRIKRAIQTAHATGVAEHVRPEREDVYLNNVDGLLFGDDPQQGFVIGRRFAHPIMRIAFDAPAGFTLTNSPQAIGITGTGDIRGEFGGGKLEAEDLDAYLRQLIRELINSDIKQPLSVTNGMINGLSARTTRLNMTGSNGDAVLLIAVYNGGGGQAFHFVIAAPAEASSATIDQLFRSFRRLSDGEAAALRPRVMKVVRAAANDSNDSLSRQMADRNGRALFVALNGDAQVKAGGRYKIVRFSATSAH
ncbi:M48 family metalloprotease [Sphingomonas crocodyli]|uniref:Peptidase M48 Ste24p n=1 Tax=Sphingomonas crocodyli TaxID=1979270 RepID=A0A437LY02_9SPHN|nr:M48 family metalloprotease [Sphingomonas crocodyli]RVT90257.1 peptidase M48 Ste24p [Sphingomonas crocodyli]